MFKFKYLVTDCLLIEDLGFEYLSFKQLGECIKELSLVIEAKIYSWNSLQKFYLK